MAFSVLKTAQARPQAVGQCKFIWVNATTLKLIPFKGNLIKINGQLYQIPAAGITITNNGFAASTLWYIYLWAQPDGSISLYGNQLGHVTSSTPGNVGVEIMSGDDSRSLVGMVYTDVNGQFLYSESVRWVRSWFNDEGISGSGGYSGTVSTSSTALIELDGNARSFLLMWAGETIDAKATCSFWQSVSGYYGYVAIGLRTAPSGGFNQLGQFSYSQAGTAMDSATANGTWTAPSDGYVLVSPGGLVSNSSVTLSYSYKMSSYTTSRK